MTPRLLRDGIRDGRYRWSAGSGLRRLPAPPPEWTEWRRERMAVAIRAAALFLQGKEWTVIRTMLLHERLIAAQVSKARIQQYVTRGVDFLLDRGCFEEVLEKGGKVVK